MKYLISELNEIGFNNLEAEVYIFLLTHPPATAYKIGKQINKPTANVYKAIDSLTVKGAVIVEENKNKICMAVNAEEFLNLYERNIIKKTHSTKQLLKKLSNDYEDQNSYSIESVSLVFERFITMMDKCTTIAVIDAFPKALNNVLDSIKKAIDRGVNVYIEAYNPIKIKGANVIFPEIGEKALKHWESQQLNLIIDGNEHLIALIDNNLEKVIQATWSNNTYMSCILHAGRMHEFSIMKILEAKDKPDFTNEVKLILEKQKYFFNSDIPGFNKLFNK
jgi:sugar-specific transcriptional regulator TrmB